MSRDARREVEIVKEERKNKSFEREKVKLKHKKEQT